MESIVIEVPDGTSQGVVNLIKKFTNLSVDLVTADKVQDDVERLDTFIGVCVDKYSICTIGSAVKLAQSK